MVGAMDPIRAPEVLRAAALEVIPDEQSVYAGGSFVQLSRRELGLLAALMRNQGRLISREDLYGLVWHGQLKEKDRSVDVYVHRLRVKLERVLPQWKFIHTHFSYGYRFHPEPVVGDNGRVTTA